jgi:dTDP-4-amino-4,6-dideoxygalactose transaminase
MTIAQMDPGAAYRDAKSEIDAAVARVLGSGWYILGREVAEFETEFAATLGLGHAVGVANGTDALVLALRALGIGRGDRVATVAHTAVATVAAIELVGAEPVLVDIEPQFCTLDPTELEHCFATVPGIKAVIPVHIYGHAADLPSILACARRYGAKVIEDCAQAHGATLGGRVLGGFGDLACFSFYPTKNLGAFGDGGAVATRDAALAQNLRSLREYGWRERYISAVAGMNSRLDELQAAILRVRLPRLAAENARRREIAAAYDRGLAGLPIALPRRRADSEPAWHQYVVRGPDRDALQQALKASGIATNIHYPVPIHLQPAYADRLLTGPSGLAVTEAVAREVLSLPMYAQLADRDVATVIAAIQAFRGDQRRQAK